MKRAKVLIIGASLLIAASPAFADGDGDGSGSAAGGAGDAGGAAGGAGGAAAAPAAEGEGGGAAWDAADAIDRPYVAAKGKIGAYGDIQIAHFSISSAGPPPISVSATQEGLHLGGVYGLTDKISAGVDYAFPLAGDGTDNSKGKGPLAFFGMFQLMHSAKMSVAATADFDLDLCGSFDAMGNCSVTKAIHAGLGAKYLVAPKIAIYTGSAYGPGPVGQQLSISLESSGPISLAIPVGVALQAAPKLMAFLDTTLMTLAIANKPSGADTATFIGSDAGGIPVDVGVLYSVSNKLDVVVRVFDNLKHAGDLYIIAGGVNIRM